MCFRKFLVWKKIWIRRGGVSRLSVGSFLSHSAKTIRRGTLRRFRETRESKHFMHKERGGSTIFCRLFYVSLYRNFRRGTIYCFTKFGYRKLLCTTVALPFSVEDFLSHSTEKVLRGTLLCFRKLLVWKSFMDKKEGGRE